MEKSKSRSSLNSSINKHRKKEGKRKSQEKLQSLPINNSNIKIHKSVASANTKYIHAKSTSLASSASNSNSFSASSLSSLAKSPAPYKQNKLIRTSRRINLLFQHHDQNKIN